MKILIASLLGLACLLTLSFYNLAPTTPTPAPTNRPIAMCGVKNDWTVVVADSLTTPMLFTNLGTYTFPINTNNQKAQLYFDQGMRLYYGFNHRESFKAFREASALDPACAICWWGQAIALGPNINMPFMDSVSSITAYEAIQKALALKSTDAREQLIIEAQASRYSKEFNADRAALDNAYVESMRKLANQFPKDADILALAAEAIMDVHFWDYWERNGNPKSWTPEILDRLTTALTLMPDHPGANHFYIHAIEASAEPEKGLPSADRLKTLMPGAGHMVHMPSHIYIRTGQYTEGSQVNILAAKADEEYFVNNFEEGMYSLAYYPHNYHFLWACATLEGNYTQAIKAAREVQSKINTAYMAIPDMSMLQHLYATPMYTLVRFGKWNDVLQEKLPFPDQPYLSGVWSYAKGLAYVRQQKLSSAWEQLAELQQIQKDPSLNSLSAWVNNPALIIQIAEKVLASEIYWQENKPKQAEKLFMEALQLEDNLRYNEPADWHQPVRQLYGAFLVSQQKFIEAEKIYREDLQLFRNNGWSLFGLYQSLKGQKKTKEANEVQQRFTKAWATADIKITSSRF